MNRIIAISIIGMLAFSIMTSFNYAYAVDNNCMINPVHILLVKIPLGCIEERLDALENATSSDLTTASNIGDNGEGVFSSEVGNDLQFKKLLSLNSTSLEITSNSTNVLFNVTASGGGGSDTTNCNNVGTGTTIHVVGSNCNAKSLLNNTGILITSDTNNILIENTQIAQLISSVFQSETRSNIGVSYVDVYQNVLVAENQYAPSLATLNATEMRIFWTWDYVGTGNHQVRWVDANNNANVLSESTTFTSDCASCNSGYFTIPSWAKSANGFSTEWQGKSSVFTDDPIGWGYAIYVR